MLNINDFRLYIRGNGEIVDSSRNAYSISNNGVTYTTDEYGITDNAMLFNSSSDELQLSSTIAQAIASDINTECSVYLRLLNDSGTATGGRLFSQMDDAVVSYSMGISAADSPSPIYYYTYDGAVEGASVSDFTKNTWSSLTFKSIDAGSSTITKKIVYDGSEIQSRTDGHNVTNSTRPLRIGKRATGQNFQGKINNLIVIKRVLTSLDVKYINKFGNRKAVA